jgi:hypothetical protein
MKGLGLPLFGDAHHPLRQCSRLYHEDLQCLENGKVLHPGAVIVADNVRCLGMRGGVGAGVWGFNVLSLFFLGGGNQDLSGPCHPNWKCSWIVSHAFECSPCPHHYHYHYGWFSGTFHAKSMGELCPMILWLMWVGNLQKHGDWCKQERVYTHRLPGVAIHHYLGEAPNYIMNQGFIN